MGGRGLEGTNLEPECPVMELILANRGDDFMVVMMSSHFQDK